MGRSAGRRRGAVLVAVTLAALTPAYAAVASRQGPPPTPSPANVPERVFSAPHGLKLSVKEVGPSGQPADLQIITLFDEASGQAFTGSMVELDERLGGALSAVRDSGQFRAEALETLMITPPPGAVAAERLLVIGLGDARRADLELMNRVGAVAAREAVRTRSATVAFAPTLRDQGFTRLDTGRVAAEVVEGALLAYDTDARLQRQGLQPCFALRRWYYEAGPAYFAGVATRVGRAVEDTAAQVDRRGDTPFSTTGPAETTCRT
ncbi:peptidase M17 [Nonomuraea terrae]|uniref:Peptidase M17 n=1 Tax=Nonomuraea terrae TaxID=2530383 RepID=A0A4R4Y8L8_9ACTN|nr:M17 family peptidase N-terminal domain-containing protein [Nonomuraea terrae]TDD40831.1 peptidase M17 [Nonomuraea terrae]